MPAPTPTTAKVGLAEPGVAEPGSTSEAAATPTATGARQMLLPGNGFINEDTALREILIPGGAFLNETSQAAVVAGAFVRIVGAEAQGFHLAGRGGLVG